MEQNVLTYMIAKIHLLLSVVAFFAITTTWSQGAPCTDDTTPFVKLMGTDDNDIAQGLTDIGTYGFVIYGRKEAASGSFRNYISRIDNCGNVLWEKLYNSDKYGIVVGVELVGTELFVGGYYATGTTFTSSNGDTYLLRLDLDGNVLDADVYGGASTSDYPRMMFSYSDGNLIHSGVTAGAGAGANDIMITKSTPAGTMIWSKAYGGSANEFGHSAMEDSYGSIVAVGYSRDYVPGLYKGRMVRVDDVGNELWTKDYYPGSGQTIIANAIEFGDNYYAVGRTDGAGYGGQDILVIKTDLDGDIVWSRVVGGSGNEAGGGIEVVDGVLYVSGSSNSGAADKQIALIRMTTDGDLLDYVAIGAAGDDLSVQSTNVLSASSKGIFGVGYGFNGSIGGNDIVFYKFNEFSDLCDPVELELDAMPVVLVEEVFPSTTTVTSWTYSSVSFTSEDVEDNQEHLCCFADLDMEVDEPASDFCVGTSNIIIENNSTTSEAATYNWEFLPDGFPATYSGDGDPPAISFATAGTKTIVYSTTICGIEYIDSLEVEIGAIPVANFEAKEVCFGKYTPFTDLSTVSGDVSIVSWSWDLDDGASSTDQNPNYLYSLAGGYSVELTVTSDLGCVSLPFTDSVFVLELPISIFSFSPSEILYVEGNTEVIFTNESLNSDSFSWDFDDGSTSTGIDPIHTFPNDVEEDYTVVLTAIHDNGCSDISWVTIEVIDTTTPPPFASTTILPEEIIFYVPNVFTPDGDAYNQTFKPIIASGIDPYDYHLVIFNRWGEIVFESYNPAVGWNGHYGSRGLVQDGTYVWHLSFGETKTDKRHEYNGHVTILK